LAVDWTLEFMNLLYRQIVCLAKEPVSLWERVVVKYETLLTLSGRVEYVRKQLFSMSVYHGG
tara:strand:- start:341 stop:526 length:186 start_codon:yes stop_codon:yes gene_type:complete